MRQLVTHVGRAHRWATAIVATRAAEPIPFREVPDGKLPDGPARAARTGSAPGRGGWLAAVRAAGDGRCGPTAARARPGYWARRMAHETAVHRADGQIALGQRPEIDPVIAADGIDEWLGFLAEPGQGGRPARLLAGLQGKVLHVHVTGEGDRQRVRRVDDPAPARPASRWSRATARGTSRCAARRR